MKKSTAAFAGITTGLLMALLIVSPSSEGIDASPSVNWESYHESVKLLIDKYAINKECGKLQIEFDAAADNSNTRRARTGEGNGDLMDYIYFEAKKAGC